MSDERKEQPSVIATGLAVDTAAMMDQVRVQIEPKPTRDELLVMAARFDEVLRALRGSRLTLSSHDRDLLVLEERAIVLRHAHRCERLWERIAAALEVKP